MGKGGEKDVKLTDNPIVTWEEVRTHNTSDDKWIVIKGEVYNITNFCRKHPGGARIISHYSGQDATEAWTAFHLDLDYIKKYMDPIHVGTIDAKENIESEMNKDFRELRETVRKMGLYKPDVLFFLATLGHCLVLELFAYLTLFYFGSGCIPFLISVSLAGTVQAQLGWIQHDYGHLSVFHNLSMDRLFHHITMGFLKAQTGWIQHDYGHLSVTQNFKLDHLLHHFIIGFIKGASAHWWNHMHNQHHAKPNMINMDPDVRVDPLFVVGKVMPIEVAEKRKRGMPYNWQNWYFFLLGPPILFPVYFQIMLFRHIFMRKKWVDLCWVISFFVKYVILFVPLLGWKLAIAYYFTMRLIESHWFIWVAQSNHIPMEIENDTGRPWLELQMRATCNIEPSFFNNWFTGHLNFQIEHHLFPLMPRHNLYKTTDLIKSLCAKHGLDFPVKPIGKAFGDIIRSLKHSGELWHQAYQLHHKS